MHKHNFSFTHSQIDNGWDNDIQLDYHKNQFNPNKIKIIIDGTHEVGYISTYFIGNILIIENILTDTVFQGGNIGTKVLLDTIVTSIAQKENIELQVFKINNQS